MPPYVRQYNLEKGICESLDDEAALSIIADAIEAKSRMIHLSLRIVRVDIIIPLCRFVFRERLMQAGMLIDYYRNNHVPLFTPIAVHYPCGVRQIVAPPILESRGDDYILCDGMHRVYTARQNGEVELKCLVINGVSIPLPGKPQTWESVRINEIQLPVQHNFEEFRPEFLTWYTKAFNGIKAFEQIAKNS
jgi:hypothetical protein